MKEKEKYPMKEETEVIFETCYYGNPILRHPVELVERVDESVRSLVTSLTTHMNNNKAGVGMAAPQLGVSSSVFVCRHVHMIGRTVKMGRVKVYINPEILEKSLEIEAGDEGCLSIPGITVNVKRAKKIKVRTRNLNWELVEETLTGWNARVFLHEFDHLQGVLITDYTSDQFMQEHATTLARLVEKSSGKPVIYQYVGRDSIQ